jgi:chromosome partitioning protein
VLDKVSPEVIVSVLVGVIVGLLLKAGSAALNRLIKSSDYITDLLAALPRYLLLRRFVLSNKTPLIAYRKAAAISRGSKVPKSICLVNFKGGVGKSTTAANLAAALNVKFAQRVLIVDLDYQGSLSTHLHSTDEPLKDTAGEWLKSGPSKKLLQEHPPEAVAGLTGVGIVTSNQNLTDVEDNMMQRWLMGLKIGGDVRTIFARILNSRQVRLADQYDIVIFDAPPRASLSTSNALYAADYIIIPAKPEALSIEPIPKLMEYLDWYRGVVDARFKVLGVMWNLTFQADGLTVPETQAIGTFLKAAPPQLASIIPDLARIRNSSVVPAYLGSDVQVRACYDRLASEVANALGIPHSSV